MRGDIAEFPSRGEARFIGREPARHQTFGTPVQMRFHLVAHFTIELRPRKERAEIEANAVEHFANLKSFH